MAFTICEMKYQLQFTVLFLLLVGSGHLVTAIRPAGPISTIDPKEVGGKDGCKLTWSELSKFPGKDVTSYQFRVENECKSCVAENVIVEVRPKNPNDGYRPVLFVVGGPISPGSSRVGGLAIPTLFQIAELSFWNVNYVC